MEKVLEVLEWSAKSTMKKDTTHPHHFVLEIISETGVLFFILYIFLTFKVILYYWNLKEKKNFFNLGCLLIFYLTFSLLDQQEQFFLMVWKFFWILLSLFIFSCINKPKKMKKFDLNFYICFLFVVFNLVIFFFSINKFPVNNLIFIIYSLLVNFVLFFF